MKKFRLKRPNSVFLAMDNLRISKKTPESKIKEKLYKIFKQHILGAREKGQEIENLFTFIQSIRQRFGKDALNYTYHTYQDSSISLLLYAMRYNYPEIVKELLDQGCDPTLKIRLGGSGPNSTVHSHVEIGLFCTRTGSVAGMMWYYGEKFYSASERDTLLNEWVDKYKRTARPQKVKEMEKTYQSLCHQATSCVVSSRREALLFRETEEAPSLIDNPLSSDNTAQAMP